jgi:hypothetical protein
MTTFTIKINERTKAGKAFRAMTETFFKDAKGIEIIENKEEKEDEIYNPEFVKMVKKSAASKKRYQVDNVDELWKSL